jgi:hypothetical protein
MKKVTKHALPQIIAAYLMLATLFLAFAWRNWQVLGLDGCMDLGVATLGVFGFIIPPFGPDLRNPKVFVVLGGLVLGHLMFCTHFLVRGVHIRPLFYIPIAILEMAISVFALIALGGARLDAYRK